jgi:hypothetical protein
MTFGTLGCCLLLWVGTSSKSDWQGLNDLNLCARAEVSKVTIFEAFARVVYFFRQTAPNSLCAPSPQTSQAHDHSGGPHVGGANYGAAYRERYTST